jgi:hypothetical protein
MEKSTRSKRKMTTLFALAIVFSFVLAAPLAAQGQTQGAPVLPQGRAAVRAWFKALDIKDTELQAIEKIIQADESTLAKDRAEIRILQAQIARMMLDQEPAMTDIENAVKKSLGWEQDIRMIQIKHQLAVRNVLGNDRWQTALLIVKEARLAEKAGRFADSFSKRGLSQAESERWTRFLRALRMFM